MRRFFRCVLAFILIISLVSSIALVSFAAEKNSGGTDPFVVTCIGDSIANGFALFRDTGSSENDSYWGTTPDDKFTVVNMDFDGVCNAFLNNSFKNDYDSETNKIVAAFEERMLSAYPLQVAMALNGIDSDDFHSGNSSESIADQFLDATNFKCLTCSGMGAIDFRSVFQKDYAIPFGALSTLSLLGRSAEFSSEEADERMTDSDLLIYALGGNDLLSPVILTIVSDEKSSFTELSSYLIQAFQNNLAAYKENTEYILNTYLKSNSGSDIVLVGLYNPLLDNDLTSFWDSYFNNYLEKLGEYTNSQSVMGTIYHRFEAFISKLNNSTLKSIGNIFSVAVSEHNSFLRELADKYQNTYYVDVNGVQTYGEQQTEKGYFAVSGDGFHPSIEGHDYIARRILSALPDSVYEKASRTVKIDLSGTPGTVTSVLVNNIPVSRNNYAVSEDGYTLSVRCHTTLASTVTVFTRGSGIGINTWQCKWNRSDGYRTYTLYKVSDIKKTATLPFSNLKNTVSSISSKIKSLFQ